MEKRSDGLPQFPLPAIFLLLSNPLLHFAPLHVGTKALEVKLPRANHNLDLVSLMDSIHSPLCNSYRGKYERTRISLIKFILSDWLL